MSQKEFIDVNATYAFGAAQVMVHVLKQCGDDLSRENIMKQAASIKDFEVPVLLNGMTINTSPTNFSPIRQMQLARFDGESWRPVRRLARWADRKPPRASACGGALRACPRAFRRYQILASTRRRPGRRRRLKFFGEARTRPAGDRTGRDASIPSSPPSGSPQPQAPRRRPAGLRAAPAFGRRMAPFPAICRGEPSGRFQRRKLR